MLGLPGRNEAAPYYYRYIDRVSSHDILQALELQREEALSFLRSITEEKSLSRYSPGKWSIRQLLNHINDCERLFVFRAFWFARGFSSALPSFDQDVAAAAAIADEHSWANHIQEFSGIRESTIGFFRDLPQEAWMRTGTASENPFTVRSLGYIIVGHADHHLSIVRERYL